MKHDGDEGLSGLFEKKGRTKGLYGTNIYVDSFFFHLVPEALPPLSKVYAQLLRNVCFTQTYSRFKRESFMYCLEMNKCSKLEDFKRGGEHSVYVNYFTLWYGIRMYTVSSVVIQKISQMHYFSFCFFSFFF